MPDGIRDVASTVGALAWQSKEDSARRDPA